MIEVVQSTINTPPKTAGQNALVLDDTITDVNSATSKYIFKTHLNTTLLVLMVCVIWVMAAFYFAMPLSSGDVLFLIFIPPLFALGIYWAIVNNSIKHQFYQQFALANGFQYQKNGGLDLSGALFNLGHSHKTQDIITGVYDGNPLTLFNYTYIIGYGKNQQTYNDSVFRVEYPTILPPILLVVDNQYFGGITGLFDGWEKIKPEGDFDKNFDLYTKKEFEIEALQVFSPDFMEKMLADWPEFNLEFNGNKLIIFHNRTITTKAELQKMYDLAQFLITKVEPLAKRMAGSVQAMEELQK